jgi:hypothetical protein
MKITLFFGLLLCLSNYWAQANCPLTLSKLFVPKEKDTLSLLKYMGRYNGKSLTPYQTNAYLKIQAQKINLGSIIAQAGRICYGDNYIHCSRLYNTITNYKNSTHQIMNRSFRDLKVVISSRLIQDSLEDNFKGIDRNYRTLCPGGLD